MHKSKHKTKTTAATDIKLPQPMKVKKEKPDEERHSMAHYIDDRLELVKQVFGSLKQKTIINLAPEFLKSKSMHKIEELCLNELLCISTKRLRSIIDATKCPTDTESSSDSDVERKEEHVSLEEISSDSEIEGSKNGGKKKTKVDATKKDTKQSADKKPENGGQISVLELLELQARARAIRSQLALEPVTKIEVKSDAEQSDKESQSGSKKKANLKRKSSEREASSSKSTTSTTKATVAPPLDKPYNSNPTNVESEKSGDQEVRKTKRIKLKRNFGRETSVREENEIEREKEVENECKNSKNIGNENEKKKEIEKDKQTSEKDNQMVIKTERKSRSVTPDVIPVVAEPVTLTIEDSSDEEEQQRQREKDRQKFKKKKEKRVKHRKHSVSGEQEKINLEKDNRKINTEEENKTEQTNESQLVEVPKKKVRKQSLPEDGELADSESEEKQAEEISKLKEAIASKPTEAEAKGSAFNEEVEEKAKEIEENEHVSSEATTTRSRHTSQNIEEESALAQDVSAQEVAEQGSLHEDSNSESRASSEFDNSNSAAANQTELDNNNTNKSSDHEERVADHDYDDNDDIISLEGGDLEKEMIAHLSDDMKSEIAAEAEEEEKKQEQKQIIEEDVISLDSTEDERSKDDESWHSRYMRSTKVSKVLATSRLGKRVRDNIKKSKHSKKESERKPSPRPDEARFSSKYEDGSVEQYKELLEMRQRKKKK